MTTVVERTTLIKTQEKLNMAVRKIDISKIKGFNEMSADDKLKALLGYEFDDNSEELSAAKDALDKQKRATDKASSEAADFKRQLRDKMSADEQAEADRNAKFEEMKAELETYKKQSRIAEYKTSALALGYSEELATKRATAMFDNDFNALADIDKQFLVAHDKEMTAKAIENTSQPPASGNGTKAEVTAEQFKNMTYREMEALQESNPQLYAELAK